MGFELLVSAAPSPDSDGRSTRKSMGAGGLRVRSAKDARVVAIPPTGPLVGCVPWARSPLSMARLRKDRRSRNCALP